MAFQHPDLSGLWRKNKAHAEEYAGLYPTRLHALAHSFFSSEYGWINGRIERDYALETERDEPYRIPAGFTDPSCSPFYQDVPIVKDTFLSELNDNDQMVAGAVLPPPAYAASSSIPFMADIDHLAALAMLLKNLHLNPQSLSTIAYTDQRREELHQKDRDTVAAALVTCLHIVERREIGGEFACACTRLSCLLPELNRLQDKYCDQAKERNQQTRNFDAMLRNLSPAERARLDALFNGRPKP